jgi:DNA polymerase-3 subunit delta
VKIAPRQIDGFLRAPRPEIRAILVYGADAGLVRERADALARSIVDDLSDPFLVAEISPASLREEPTLIADEAAAISMTGGRRVVRVRDASDAMVGPLERLLDDSPGDGLVIVQAGALTTRAGLRKLFESADNAAAIACFADDAQSLDRLIHDTLAQRNITASHDASAYLVANLGADRGVSRSELEKLMLYVGEGATVSLDDAMASVGNSSAVSLDNLVMAAASGDGFAADQALTRSYQEGANPVSVLRALGRHLTRLHLTRAKIDTGVAADSAMKALRPPVFYKLAPAFRTQLRQWNARKLVTASGLVLEAERQCKQTGAPAQSLCGRAVLQISRLAIGGAQRRS